MEKIKYNGIIEKLVEEGTKNITKYVKVINDNEPVFDEIDYDVKEGEPVYFELDEQGRSNGAIAVISQNTIPLIINKNLQYPNPNGWNKSLEKKYLFQRCHIVAYSLSAKLADKKNIFIGTQDLNTSIMATIEKKVKKYVEQTGDKVLYKVTVKYKGIDKIQQEY